MLPLDVGGSNAGSPTRSWTFPSRSEPGTTRTVNLVDGRLTCDCPNGGRNCWHVLAAKAQLGGKPEHPTPKTKGGYDASEVVSALQKCLRRGLEEDALYWVSELDRSGFGAWAFKRLRVVAVEDVGLADPLVHTQVRALYEDWSDLTKAKSGDAVLMLIQATRLLARSKKNRANDHAWYCYWSGVRERKPVPDWVLDKHTTRGRRMGRGNEHFMTEGSKLANEGDVDPYRDRAHNRAIPHKPPEEEET